MFFRTLVAVGLRTDSLTVEPNLTAYNLIKMILTSDTCVNKKETL